MTLALITMQLQHSDGPIKFEAWESCNIAAGDIVKNGFFAGLILFKQSWCVGIVSNSSHK